MDSTGQPQKSKSVFPRFWRKIPFVKTAPTKSGGNIPVHVSKMTLDHVRWWHSHVQPVVDENPSRADQYWNWILISASSNFTGSLLSRRPKGFTLGIESGGSFIPCALVQLIGKFPFFIDRKKKSVFVWYLAVAPEEALLALKDVSLKKEMLPKMLGSISLDTAVAYSFNSRRKGRTSLHAAPEGGDKLLQWYTRRGMTIYPDEEKLHFGFRRLFIPSDGRYCYFTEDAALKEIEELNPYR